MELILHIKILPRDQMLDKPIISEDRVTGAIAALQGHLQESGDRIEMLHEEILT